MVWLTSVPVYTTSEDYLHYHNKGNTNLPIGHWPHRPTEYIFFPNNNDRTHPFNTVLPNGTEQPILDLLYELCTQGAVIIESEEYQILDPSRFYSACHRRKICIGNPPTPQLSSPSFNPDHHAVISEYYALFAVLHRTPSINLQPADRNAIAARYAATLIPPAATQPKSASSDDDYTSDSSYEITEPARDPANGRILRSYRVASYNHAARCANYRNAKHKLAHPEYEYTPRPEIVKPKPRVKHSNRHRKYKK